MHRRAASAKEQYTIKRAAILAHAVRPTLSGAEAVLYTDTDWTIFDQTIASYGRRALDGRASGQADERRRTGGTQSVDQREDQAILETTLCENRSQSPKAPMDAGTIADLRHTAKSSRQCSATYRSKNHEYQTRAESYDHHWLGGKDPG